jgi:site-specific recombinase XerD
MAMTSQSEKAQSAAARFDHAFLHARKKPPSTSTLIPQLSSSWPPENIAALEQYQDWLYSGGTGPEMVEIIYVPTAGYALSLNLEPCTSWNLETEFDRALAYIQSRGLSDISTNIRRNALEKFRQFLRQKRGQYEVHYKPINYERYYAGLPDWLIEQLNHFQHLWQANWRPARLHQQIMRFWGRHTRIWRWLFEHYPIEEITDIKRQYLFEYVDHCVEAGYAARSINHELRVFRSFLLFLQDQGFHVTQSILRVPSLKEPKPLPRFLTDDQVRRMREDLEERVTKANTSARLRDALLDRAAFYLLWQGGMRLGEVEELRGEDLDFSGRKLTVRQGKNLKDRPVYLTNTASKALQEYLAVRGSGPTDHVFYYRHRPVSKDLIGARVRACGQRVGVKVSPHRLRHTCATQLLNAGCRVTSIQKFLGHERIDTTMIYAQVHNKSVSEDYYSAMSRIEKQLDLVDSPPENLKKSIGRSERDRLLLLIDQLAENQVEGSTAEIVEKMRCLLDGLETYLPGIIAPREDHSLNFITTNATEVSEIT